MCAGWDFAVLRFVMSRAGFRRCQELHAKRAACVDENLVPAHEAVFKKSFHHIDQAMIYESLQDRMHCSCIRDVDD